MKQDFKKIKEHFELYEISKLRSTLSGTVQEHIEHYQKRLLPLFSDFKDLKILDVGCGEGMITRYFSELYPKNKYLGIDLSDKNIEIANERYKSENIGFTQSDISQSKHNIEEKFDLIFSFSVIQYFDKESFILLTNNLRNILNKGGVIVHMSIPDKDFFWKNRIGNTLLSPLKLILRYPFLIQEYNTNKYTNGFWWDKSIMNQLLKQEFDIEFLRADSFYRFDVIMRKNDK